MKRLTDKNKKYENTETDPEDIEKLKKEKEFWHREAVKAMAKLGEIRILAETMLDGKEVVN